MLFLSGKVAAGAGGNRNLPQPEFDVPLTHSLIPAKGIDAVFGRASTATVVDFDGKVNTALEDEARFTGARRVENICLSLATKGLWEESEDMVGNVTYGTEGGHGCNIAFTTTTTTFEILRNPYLIPLNIESVVRCEFRLNNSLATNTTLRLYYGGDFLSEIIATSSTTTGEWHTATTVAIGTALTIGGAAGIYIHNHGIGEDIDIDIRNLQYENVLGQSNQNPSEYVSVGVGTIGGQELIADTTFQNWTGDNPDGWNVTEDANSYVTEAVDGAQLICDDGTVIGTFNYPNIFEVNKTYKLTITNTNTTGNIKLGYSPSADQITSRHDSTDSTYIFEALGATLYIQRWSGITDVTIHSISVQEVVDHGTGVDGVKYFNYENANTVDGTALTDNAPSGYPTATNSIINSVLDGGTAGTPGTAPTSWAASGTGGTVDYPPAPSGGGTAVEVAVIAERHLYIQSVSVTTNSVYVFSVDCKILSSDISPNQLTILINAPANSSNQHFVDGVLVNPNTPLPEGSIHRVSVVLTTTDTGGTPTVRIGVGTSSVVTGTAQLYNPQFEVGSLSTPYIPTTTEPVTRYGKIPDSVLKGALLEEESTNVLLNSVFDGAVAGTPGTPPTSWGLTIGGGSLEVRQGDIGIAMLVTVSTDRHYYSQSIAVTTGNSYSYSTTVDVKSGNIEGLQLLQISALPVDTTKEFYVDGILTNENLFVPIGLHKLTMIIHIVNDGVVQYRFGVGTSNTTTGSAEFYNIQVEELPYATSYIPTTTVAVTRSPDVLSYDYQPNALSGSMLAELNDYYDGGNGASQYGLAASEGCRYVGNGSVGNLQTYDGTTALLYKAPTDNIVDNKFGVTWEGGSPGETILYLDGSHTVTGAIDATGFDPGSNPLGIGSAGDISTGQLSCNYKNIKFYNEPLDSDTMKFKTS